MSKTYLESGSRPEGLGSKMNLALWVASLAVAFLVVPYHDIFGGQRYQPPEMFQPLIFRLMVAAGLRILAGCCLGERHSR